MKDKFEEWVCSPNFQILLYELAVAYQWEVDQREKTNMGVKNESKSVCKRNKARVVGRATKLSKIKHH